MGAGPLGHYQNGPGSVRLNTRRARMKTKITWGLARGLNKWLTASCKHRVDVSVTKRSFCAKIESAIPRTPRCRMGSSPDLECRTRTACQSATHAAFLPYGAARRSTRDHSAFPEASHPVGEHAAGACALPAASPGGPRSSAPTWPPLPRRLERLNRPARPRCHSTLRLTLARSWPARLNLARAAHRVVVKQCGGIHS